MSYGTDSLLWTLNGATSFDVAPFFFAPLRHKGVFDVFVNHPCQFVQSVFEKEISVVSVRSV